MWIDRKRIRREVCAEMGLGCVCDGLACDITDEVPDCDKQGGCEQIGFTMNAVIDALAGEAIRLLQETVYDPKSGTVPVLTKEVQQQLREAKEVGEVGELTAPVIIKTETGGILLATGDTVAILK